jgi:hypothetical protein
MVKSSQIVKTNDFTRFQIFYYDLNRLKSLQITILPEKDYTSDLT